MMCIFYCVLFVLSVVLQSQNLTENEFEILLFAVFVLVVSLPQIVWAKSSSVRISEKEVSEKTMDEFVDGLMSRMTVAEKIGQLNLPGYGDVSKDAKRVKSQAASARVRLAVSLISSASTKSVNCRKWQWKKAVWVFLF